jgi:mannose-6-phosphate isomerase
LSRRISREELRERAVSGTIEDVLHYVSVQPGDSLLVEANTIHSIGAGLLLYEVQQPSHVTYRLYDWNRKSADGQTRELHLDKAVQVANLEPATDGARKRSRKNKEDSDQCEELVRCSHFVLERLTFSKPWPRSHGRRSFEALTVIRGAVKIIGEEGPFEISLGAGQSILVPAALSSYILAPEGTESQVLVARLPD